MRIRGLAVGALVGLVIPLAIAEVFWQVHLSNRTYRQWQAWYAPNGFVKFRLEPNLRVDAARSRYKTAVVTNSVGLRGPELPLQKPKGSLRVLCVGGSTTFGTYSSDNQHTYPALLERRLREMSPQVEIEVINAGVPGYTTTHTLIHLATRLMYFEPDLVIIYHAINDLRDNNRYKPDVTPFDLLGSPWCKGGLKSLFKKSVVWFGFQQVRERWLQASQSASSDHSPGEIGEETFHLNPRPLLIYLNNLETIVRLIRQHSAQAAFIRFPYPSSLRGNLSNQLLYAGMTGSELAAGLDAYNDASGQLATRLLVPLLEPSIPDDAELWGDYCHLNDSGSEALVESIGNDVLDLLRRSHLGGPESSLESGPSPVY